MHVDDINALEYKPLVNFVDNPPPGELRTCSAYVMDACAVLPECKFVRESVEEVGRITASKLESPELGSMLRGANITGAMLFAIILYTFDLCMITTDYRREQCWYHALNVHLRERKADFLRVCHGYIYFLMTGLTRLAPYGEGHAAVLYRGIDSTGRERAIRDYHDGRRLHWSGFSSATPDLNVARNFAGPDGLILRIRLLKKGSQARDIRALSALQQENEVLLLPNFPTIVNEEAKFDPSLGVHVVDLKEMSKAGTSIF
jgi:hypothetical protein